MAGYKLGLDIGSTTIKLVLIDENKNILFERYRRHFSDVRGELLNLFKEIAEECGEYEVTSAVTGSGGLSVANLLGLPFTQEVVAGAKATQEFIPQADVVLELGGEDAKTVSYTHLDVYKRQILRQCRQSIHPCKSLPPTCMISVSIPYFSSVSHTMRRLW